jgi:hypothetical protein
LSKSRYKIEEAGFFKQRVPEEHIRNYKL